MIKKITNENKDVVMNYVLQEPAINLFIIGDIEQFGLDVDFQEAFLQYNNDDITACILRYYGNVVIYSHIDCFNVEEIIKLINKMNYHLISGKKTVMDLLLPYLSNIDEIDECYFCKLENTFKLEKIKLVIEKAGIEDLHKLYDLMKLVGFASINYIESNTRKIESKAGRVYYLNESDKIISSAGTSIESSVSAMIGGVATHDNYRNKGYASQVVSKLCQDLLDEGKTPCLFFSNPKAGSIYHRLGFDDIDMWTMVKFKK